ncbi:MAG: hypothetical protein IKC03_04785 [Oscillospiraceae bacterium]|nr:hypothetical protein [Oscillospiraceae bacterium]
MYIYRINDLKQASFDRLETTVQYHIIPNLGRMKIDKVTRDDVQGLIASESSTSGIRDALMNSAISASYSSVSQTASSSRSLS